MILCQDPFRDIWDCHQSQKDWWNSRNIPKSECPWCFPSVNRCTWLEVLQCTRGLLILFPSFLWNSLVTMRAMDKRSNLVSCWARVPGPGSGLQRVYNSFGLYLVIFMDDFKETLSEMFNIVCRIIKHIQIYRDESNSDGCFEHH
jgi:hypothetical protein